MNVMICDRLTLEAETFLRSQLGPDHEVLRVDPKTDFERLKNADVIITRTKFPIDESVLKKAENLKLVVTVTSGFDHVDIYGCQQRNIQVVFTPEGNQQSAAELTIGLALAALRKLPLADKKVREGDWGREDLMGRELQGKTWGIVGLGRIGRRVARLAQAFEMKVIAFDPYVEESIFDEYWVTRCGFKEVTRDADILSLHVPLTKLTKNMINETVISEMHDDTIIINTSRGGVVHEKSLADALEKGKIGGAALDVFEHEPLKTTSDLLSKKNLTVSPHCGALTKEAFEKGSLVAAKRVIEFVKEKKVTGGDPFHEVWIKKEAVII